jgi:hypothetical protein
MSNAALNWAFDQPLPMAQKFVLVVLADYADEEHSSFPAQSKIAERIGATDRTVRSALKELEAKGFVSREHRQRNNGSRTSDRYFLPVNGSARMPGPTGSTFRGQPETPSDPTGSKGGDHNHHLSITSNPHLEERAQPENASATDEQFDRFWQAFPTERKSNKKGCRTKFAKAVKDGIDPEHIIGAALAYRDDPNRESAFTVNPHRWLNEERWDDGPLPPRSGSTSPSDQRLQRGLQIAQAAVNHQDYDRNPFALEIEA